MASEALSSASRATHASRLLAQRMQIARRHPLQRLRAAALQMLQLTCTWEKLNANRLVQAWLDEGRQEGSKPPAAC